MKELHGKHHPCYVISVAAELTRMHPQTLRRYERLGLLKPARASGRRLYSQADLEQARQIAYLTEELGINLVGAEMILELRRQLDDLQAEVQRLRQRLRER